MRELGIQPTAIEDFLGTLEYHTEVLLLDAVDAGQCSFSASFAALEEARRKIDQVQDVLEQAARGGLQVVNAH